MLQNPKYNMNYISNFLAIRNATTNANASSLPQSPHILGPQQTNTNSIDTECELDETQLEKLGASAAGKSFTIASILGLKKKNAAAANAEAGQNQKPKELNAMNLSIHNNQNFQLQNKTFGSIDVDNRLLQNRIPLTFPHHHLHNPSAHQQQQQQQSPHFYPQPNNNVSNSNNNNNNNLSVANHNGAASALQSLQQQFHTKSGSNFPPFHGKEQHHHQRHKTGTEHSIKGKSSLKSKRVRTIFTPEQLERLEAEFERQQYMVGPERLYLAHTLQLTEAQVKVWFQNRRIKWRKHHLEMTQQRLAIIRQCQTTQPINAGAGAGNEPRIVTSDKPAGRHVLSSSSPALTEFDRESATTTGNETAGARDSSELSICTNSMDSSPDGI